jgi:hypothetical protein
MRMRWAVFSTFAAGLLACGEPVLAQAADLAEARYEKDIQPLLRRFCYDCHGEAKQRAGLSLQAFLDADAARKNRKVWESVLRLVREREMPPEGRPQPSDAERESITRWIESDLFPVDCSRPDPGRVTLRRLNRVEYNNTIRDLAGVDVKPADSFPADDAGYGFDNIGDVLSVSPLLLEKYLAAAEQMVERVLADPRAKGRVFFGQPTAETGLDRAGKILGEFARRAWRRPVSREETGRLTRLADQALGAGESFEAAVGAGLQAILVSPHFLFRGELQPDPDNPNVTRPVDEFALASRMSYFLWSSMPDEELFELAERGHLRQNLEAQVARMLRDPKVRALSENFAGQWLQLRNLGLVTPDAKEFPGFDEELRRSMRRETELLFETILREDRSVFEFLTADYTYVNERLARHYGIRGVAGPEFRRVSLVGTPRGGVLTHASVLTITSNPTRTSPVKRGKWVLENLLAAPPPPPPPEVPPLNESQAASASASLRQRLEQHRDNPMCASCHAQMDPIGFGLEHFDGTGAWRERDGAFPVDARGRLVSGESFDGASELSALLATIKRDQFARCVAERMLTYALGRGLEHYDQCALNQITAGASRHGHRFSSLVLEVVKSVPFQMRRGEGERR